MQIPTIGAGPIKQFVWITGSSGPGILQGLWKKVSYYFGHKKDVFPLPGDQRWNIIKRTQSSIKRNANISTENGERVVFLCACTGFLLRRKISGKRVIRICIWIDRLPPSIDASLLKGNYTSKVSITLSTLICPSMFNAGAGGLLLCCGTSASLILSAFFIDYGREQIVDKKFTAFDYIKRGWRACLQKKP